MSSLCKYKHIFGQEKKGFHAQRLMGIAIYDTIGTILLAWFFSFLAHTDFWWTLIAFFVLAVILHRLFCVNTTVNKFIFGKV